MSKQLAGPTSKILPSDCVILPLSRGGLLVSPRYAVFCRVSRRELEALRQVISGAAPLENLSQALLNDLERHGFFGPPRPAKPDPPTVQIQLTNACNLACVYCCTNSGRPRPKEVCFEQMLQVVRQIPEALGAETSVALLGGEPLFVPWALSLAEAIILQGSRLTIFTNGVPLAETPGRTVHAASTRHREGRNRQARQGII